MMLESVVSNEEQVKASLLKNNNSIRVYSINFGLLTDIIAFLQPLKEATKDIEGDQYPTIHRVLLWKFLLLQKTKIDTLDSDLINQLKMRLASALEAKFEIIIIHKLALFLHPQYKSLKKLLPDDRLGVHQLAQDYIATLQCNDTASAQRNNSDNQEGSSR